MASTDALPIPLKNTAYRVSFPIFDADGDLVTGATGLDSEVSKDGGTFADCTNEATEIATSSGMYYLDLTSTEMNADTVIIIVKTTTSGAKTTPIILYPKEAGNITVVLEGVTHTGATIPTVTSVTNGVTLASAAVQAIWDALTSALTTTGSIGKRIVDYLTGDSYARLGSPVGASISADIASIQSDTNDIQTRIPAALSSGLLITEVRGFDSTAQNIISTAAIAGSVDTLSVSETLKVLLAVITGKLVKATEGDAVRYTFYDYAGTTDTLNALVDSDGRDDITISV